MLKSNKIIQSFWHGHSLSQIEILCIRSFLLNFHEFHLYTYNNDLKNVPPGCVIKDANEIIPESLIFLDSRKSICSFSDYFRVKMLFEKGGWWVDMDIICLKTFDIKEKYSFSTEYYGNLVHPNIGCIKCPKNSKFLSDYIGVIEDYLKLEKEVIWGQFGPSLIKNLLSQYESQKYIHSPEKFIMPKIICSPKNELLFFNLFKKQNLAQIEEGLDGYSIHLYNELWNCYNLDKSKKFPPDSVLKYLSNKYFF